MQINGIPKNFGTICSHQTSSILLISSIACSADTGGWWETFNQIMNNVLCVWHLRIIQLYKYDGRKFKVRFKVCNYVFKLLILLYFLFCIIFYFNLFYWFCTFFFFDNDFTLKFLIPSTNLIFFSYFNQLLLSSIHLIFM